MKTIVPVLVGVSLALACAAGHAQEAAKDVLKVSIERKSLRDALNDWAQQTGNQLIAEIKGEFVAPKIEGKLTAEQALERLLEGTPLTYEWMGERLVAVKEKGRVLPAALQSTSADGKDQAPIRVARLSGNELGRVELAANEQSTRQNDQGSRIERRTRDVGSDTKTLEEIVVTAQKREQRLIDVPQSVSVLSGDALAKLGAVQFRDFANRVPGLAFSTAGAGNTRIVLRGVTTGYDVASTVATYVDEVPYGSSSAFTASDRFALDVGLFDIERVEVLRGPQGTLYGASSMGGLVKYVTRQPDMTRFGIDAQTGVSHTEDGGVSYNGAITANTPLVRDKMALRTSGFYSHDGGYIDNLALDQNDVNQADIYGGRADLLFEPSERLSIRTAAFLQNISRNGEATSDYSFAGESIDGSLEQRRLFAEPFDQQFRVVSATASYDFGSAALTSISSYQTARTEYFQDVSPGYVPLFTSVGIPISAAATSNIINIDKFTQEVRLGSQKSRPLEWVVGGFYTQEDSEQRQDLLVLDPAGQPAPNLFMNDLNSRYEEYAAFGDLTWHLTDKFDVTGGVRYARNSQESTQIASGLFVSSRPTSRSDENVFTYLGNMRYHLSDRATLYVRYATGYRPGGPNFPGADTITGEPRPTAPFEADRLRSYEIGFKAETENRGFEIDVATYYIDWSNVQITVVRGGFGAIANAPGGARVQGAELAITARPVSALTIAGALAYQDGEMLEADTDLGARKGERLPNVPRFTASVDADYAFAAEGIQPTIGMSLRHVGDRTASFDNTLGFLQYHIPDYSTVDLRAGVTLGSLSAQLYVRNVSDEDGQASALNTWQGLSRPAILQPRTIGVSMTTRF